MSLTSATIAAYASELSFDQITDEAVTAAERLTLDSLGCCLGAYTSPPSKRLRRLYGEVGTDGEGEATVLGAGTGTRVEYAGLINATMVRYLDYNDTYISQGRACHPSDHIPALISIAEAEGATGEDLVEAIVLAYEVEGLGIDTGLAWEHGYDYVTWGAYSSVAAAGALMGLSEGEIQNALGIAGASNLTLSASRRGDVSMWKGIAHPYVTHSAIQACQMAREGITGPAAVFEGPGGLFEVADEEPIEIDRLGGRDGAPFRITDAHVKPYPCGYYMQPMIAGVVELVTEHDITPGAVEEVVVETFAEAAAILATPEKWSTDLTRESADHSIPYTAAIALTHGDVRPEHYDERHRTDPAIHDLMGRVAVEERAELNEFAATNPRATPTVVRLVVDGTEYRTRIDRAPGHAENPLSDEAFDRKLTELVGPLLEDGQVASLREGCRDLASLSRVDALVDATIV